jgi:hypothetical protein
MMLAFDTPIPFSTIGRRNVSNVPAQALILMNDPFVAEQSRHWARRISTKTGMTTKDRVREMYVSALSREPMEAEMTAALGFLGLQAREYGIRAEDAEREERVWADLAHVIFNVKEFVLIQ